MGSLHLSCHQGLAVSEGPGLRFVPARGSSARHAISARANEPLAKGPASRRRKPTRNAQCLAGISDHVSVTNLPDGISLIKFDDGIAAELRGPNDLKDELKHALREHDILSKHSTNRWAGTGSEAHSSDHAAQPAHAAAPAQHGSPGSHDSTPQGAARPSSEALAQHSRDSGGNAPGRKSRSAFSSPAPAAVSDHPAADSPAPVAGSPSRTPQINAAAVTPASASDGVSPTATSAAASAACCQTASDLPTVPEAVRRTRKSKKVTADPDQPSASASADEVHPGQQGMLSDAPRPQKERSQPRKGRRVWNPASRLSNTAAGRHATAVLKLEQQVVESRSGLANVAHAQPVPAQTGDAILQQHNLNAHTSKDLELLRCFSGLAYGGQLAKALAVIETCKHAERTEVLLRVQHNHFLRNAERKKDVKAALRFLDLLPGDCIDARTFNMAAKVCAAAGDAKSAIQVADLYRQTGNKVDVMLYTSVITACAEAADSDSASAVYQQMLQERCRPDRRAMSALVSAYAASVRRQGPSATDRRTQLVLLERAFQLRDDLVEMNMTPDAVMWNTLITLAGRAGQLQRALDTVSEMEASHCMPDEFTFATIINACTLANKPQLGLKVYERAMKAKAAKDAVVYSAAISACKAGAEANAQRAMQIYHDMQLNGVRANSRLYAALMAVMGTAGEVDLAFSLLDEMETEGLRPDVDTLSSLVLCCVMNNQLDRAQQVYQMMRGRQMWPKERTYTALIAAMGRAFRLGDVADLVADMGSAGLEANAHTCAALLSACQRADEPELCFDLYKLMKVRGIRVDDECAFQLLRLCYNSIRALWRPGGYPAMKNAPMASPLPGRRSQAGTALLKALGWEHDEAQDIPSDTAGWQARALGVYRDALAAGPPRLDVLDRMLACLRQPREIVSPKPTKASSSNSDVINSEWKVRASYTESGFSAPKASSSKNEAKNGPIDIAQAQGVWGGFQERAMALVEDAVTMGVLPSYSQMGSADLLVDCCQMPPNVAECYTLTLLFFLQRRLGATPQLRTRALSAIMLKVPAYAPTMVFYPKYPDEDAANRSEPSTLDSPDSALEDSPTRDVCRPHLVQQPSQGSCRTNDYQAGTATALSVAAALQRMRTHPQQDTAKGLILLEAAELTRWAHTLRRATVNQRVLSGTRELNNPDRRRKLGGTIAHQAAAIRMSDVGSDTSWGPGRTVIPGSPLPNGSVGGPRRLQHYAYDDSSSDSESDTDS